MVSQPELHLFISRRKIAATVNRLASEISRDYHDKNPLLLSILKGSFMFLADLLRELAFPLEIDFITVSSYGAGTETSGNIRLVHEPRCPLEGRHVLVIEDIIDSGLTTSFIRDYAKKQKVASVKLCALLDKPERRQVHVPIDYLGVKVTNKFLVGYGLDCAEKYRNLPEVFVLEES